MGRGWAATFLASLQYRNSQGAALVQGNGRRINFREPTTVDTPDGTSRQIWQAFAPGDGSLHVEGDYTLWSLPDGRQLKFKDRFLVNISFPGSAFLKLYYVNQRIDSVTDEYGSQLSFDYYPNHAKLPSYIEPGDESTSNVDSAAFGSAAARLQRLTLPNGQVIEYDYDQIGNLTRVRYPDSTERIYHYDNNDYPSHLTGLTDRRGQRLATWGYNGEGYAILSERADGVERVDLTYNHPEFNGGIGTTTVTNSLGEQSTYTWQRHHDAGQALVLKAEGAGCVTCPPTDYNYSYNDQFQLAEATRGDGSGVRWEYDEQGRTTASYRRGSDGSERLMQEQVYEVPDTTQANTNSTRPIAIRYPSVSKLNGEHHEMLLDYNEDGLPVQITERGFTPKLQEIVTEDGSSQSQDLPTVIGFEPIERVTSLDYENGRITSIDGPRTDVADTVTFTYQSTNADAATALNQAGNNATIGHLSEVGLPGGQRLYLSKYNADGQATEIRYNTSSPFQLTYDDNRRLVSVTQRGNTQRFHYDAEGRTVGVIDADGRHTRIDYDAAGRMNRVTDDIGRDLHWLHNGESRRTEQRTLGFNGEEVQNLKLFYDALGQLSSRTEERTNYSTGSLVSQSTEFTHDAAGKLIKATDTDSARQVDYNWNPFGELLAVSTPFTEVTDAGYKEIQNNSNFSYDSKGQLTSITDARNNTTTYVLDDFGRRVAEHSPDTGTTRFERDAIGNAIKKTNANGDTTTYTYDSANRVLTKSNRDGITTFAYHPTNGHLIETTNPTTTENYEYDSEGQLVAHSREIQGRTFITTYNYDEHGRISQKALPDGTQLRYHYHARAETSGPTANAGQLRAITKSSLFGIVQETLVGEIDEDARDGLTRHVNHNGSVTEKRFHPDGSLQTISVSDGLQLAYEFDDNGQITTIDKDGTLSKFGYLNGHLTQAVTSQGSYIYHYDTLGNRTQESTIDERGKLEQESYNYPRAGRGNRLLSKNESTYDYNAGGALKKNDRYRYDYNADQRPIRVYEGDKLIAEYNYNSFGERIHKVVYGERRKRVTYFLYEGRQLSAEIEASEETTVHENYRQTIYLGHTPVAYLHGSQTYAVQSDHMGTPHRVTDSDNRIVWAANYEPFGEATVTTEKIAFRHRFPGQYFDSETGTHYNYLRDYDPANGRYTTSDPIGLLAGPNTYGYVGGNPTRFFDSLGLSASDRVVLTQVQYDQLQDLANAGRRTEYYFLLHNLTGSRLAFEMAQISSNSGQLGGVAWVANNYILANYPELYPPDASGTPDIQVFSEMIFLADFNAIESSACTDDGFLYEVPTDLEMVQVALGVWQSVGLGAVAPPLVRYYLETIGLGGDAFMMINVASEVTVGGNLVPDEYDEAFSIIAEASDQEIMFIDVDLTPPFVHITDSEDLYGIYEPEFIRDHTEYEIEYSADCLSKLMSAPITSRDENISEEQEAIYELVSASPTHDVIVVATNSVEYNQCIASR